MKCKLNCNSCKYYIAPGEVNIYSWCIKGHRKFGLFPNKTRCRDYEYKFSLNDDDKNLCGKIINVITDSLKRDEEKINSIEVHVNKKNRMIEVMNEKTVILMEEDFKNDIINVYLCYNQNTKRVCVDRLTELKLNQALTSLIDDIVKLKNNDEFDNIESALLNSSEKEV